MEDKKPYILGTDKDELFRLGLQHQVWASEAQKGWQIAGFAKGDKLLDLGSGPGFCSKELAYITGSTGSVISVDKSEHYISYLNALTDLHQINIQTQHCDFFDMKLEDNSLDGMYCRWALAWVDQPKPILEKVYRALKPGGTMVIQEYYDWSTHQTEPKLAALNYAIGACLKSFKTTEGEIDIGRELPEILSEMGMVNLKTRILAKMATKKDISWQWPTSFYKVYFPKLVELGYLSQDELNNCFRDLEQLEKTPYATIFCPAMIEIIATK